VSGSAGERLDGKPRRAKTADVCRRGDVPPVARSLLRPGAAAAPGNPNPAVCAAALAGSAAQAPQGGPGQPPLWRRGTRSGKAPCPRKHPALWSGPICPTGPIGLTDVARPKAAAYRRPGRHGAWSPALPPAAGSSWGDRVPLWLFGVRQPSAALALWSAAVLCRFSFSKAGSPRRQGESSSSSSGLLVHLRLLPTSPHGDAVTLRGFGPYAGRDSHSADSTRSGSHHPRRAAGERRPHHRALGPSRVRGGAFRASPGYSAWRANGSPMPRRASTSAGDRLPTDGGRGTNRRAGTR